MSATDLPVPRSGPTTCVARRRHRAVASGLRLLGLSCAARSVRHLAIQAREERYLRRYVCASPISSQRTRRDELVAIKRAVSSAIGYDVARRDEPRPRLRSSAAQTLAAGYGFCGENARLSIVLLRMRGIRAHRLYLRGSAWDHVAVEHRWGCEWVLFDAHDDPGTLLADDAVGTISSDDLDRFPNAASEWNEWRRATRLKLLLRVRSGPADHWRPPPIVVGVVERPNLVRCLANLACSVACITLARACRTSPGCA